MKSYDLTLAAEEDLKGIWLYTCERWGFEQAETYFDRISARCDHHYIVWLDEGRPIIIAILHERMDFLRCLKDRLEP